MKYILLKNIQLSLRMRHKAMLSFPNTSSSAKKRVCHSCLSGNQAIGKTGAVEALRDGEAITHIRTC